MTFDDHVLVAVERGRRNITEIQSVLPLFMRADIRSALVRLQWRGRVVRKVGTGYLPADDGCPRRVA